MMREVRKTTYKFIYDDGEYLTNCIICQLVNCNMASKIVCNKIYVLHARRNQLIDLILLRAF